MRLQASVVLDLGSYAHRVGEAKGTRYAHIDLVRLVALLDAHGLETMALTVAGPFLEAQLGVGGDERLMRSHVAQASQWWEDECASWRRGPGLSVPLRRLLGGTTGRREVGVDVLVAGAALDAAGRIAERHAADDEVVVVCTHDSDLFHLHRYAAPVRLYVAGRFAPSEGNRLAEQEAPCIGLHPAAFAEVDRASALGPVALGISIEELGDDVAQWPPGVRLGRPGDQVVVASDGHSQVVRSTPLNRCVSLTRPGRAPLRDARTVAVVDPYGLANAAVRSIGVARLPRAGAFQALLASLAWDHPVAVCATIPDLDHGRMQGLASELRMAWRRRDADLDELAHAFAADADRMTRSTRSLLQPDAVGGVHPDGGHERDLAAHAIKRMATGLIADLWLAATTNPRAQVVLCSDDPDLTWALDVLRGVVPATFAEVVRVGVHARRYRIGGDAASLGDERPLPGPFVVLTDTEIARLVGVHDAPFGRRLRHAVHCAVADGRPWSPRALDPETGALTVRTTIELDGPSGTSSDHAIEAHLFGGDVALAPIGSASEAPAPGDAGLVRLDLAFDPRRPCAHPVLMAGYDAGGSVEATVVAAGRGRLSVDVNGDGRPDGDVDVAHDFTHHVSGSSIMVRQQTDGGWCLVDPGHGPLTVAEPEVVEVLEKMQDGWLVRAIGEGDVGPVDPVPGEERVDAAVGDLLFAVRIDAAVSRWTAVSTPLGHLRSLYGETPAS